MMQMREDQMQAFADADEKSFEDRMVTHLSKHFPDHSGAMDEPEMREIIRRGIEHASRYRFTSEKNVCKFIDLMFAFGENFDRDRPWAYEILSRPVFNTTPNDRMRTLTEAAMCFLYEVSQGDG